MHAITTEAVVLASLMFSAAAEPQNESNVDRAQAMYQELSASMPTDGEQAKSARLELEYWHKHPWSSLLAPVRETVNTKEGNSAEVILLNAPSMSMPGTDFSMVFLLVENRVVDWASCWTYNRTARHQLLLEDVNGDGIADIAFRASKGWWGLQDKRQHRRPGDKRIWLYAYVITTEGFQSIFPETERHVSVKCSYDTAGYPVTLQIKGIPYNLRERRLTECTLSLTNASRSDLAIEPGEWFDVKIEDAGLFMTYGPHDMRTSLKPGESVSQVIRLFLYSEEKAVAMHWKFVPTQRSEDSP